MILIFLIFLPPSICRLFFFCPDDKTDLNPNLLTSSCVALANADVKACRASIFLILSLSCQQNILLTLACVKSTFFSSDISMCHVSILPYLNFESVTLAFVNVIMRHVSIDINMHHVSMGCQCPCVSPSLAQWHCILLDFYCHSNFSCWYSIYIIWKEN